MNLLMKILIVSIIMVSAAFGQVKIVNMKGEVQVRKGMAETWQPAMIGALLENMDSILTGENGQVELQTGDGRTFRLGSWAVIDISDLRLITEREMFLLIMAKKIEKLDPVPKGGPLRIGNVSVVHGENKNIRSETEIPGWRLELNGARDLYNQNYFTNAVVKLYSLNNRYATMDACGEIALFLGRAFEVLAKPGQALKAYQEAAERLRLAVCDDEIARGRRSEIEAAIQRLQPR